MIQTPDKIIGQLAGAIAKNDFRGAHGVTALPVRH